MGTRALPDMYALSPWACGPRASGTHIRQSTRAHVITIIFIVPSVLKSNFLGHRHVLVPVAAAVTTKHRVNVAVIIIYFI